eukprot:2548381-Pyramimonas_sp.AAC.1
MCIRDRFHQGQNGLGKMAELRVRRGGHPHRREVPLATPRSVQAAERFFHPAGEAAVAPAMAPRIQDLSQGAGSRTGGPHATP